MKKGFTVTEILITVVVFALLLGFTVPKFLMLVHKAQEGGLSLTAASGTKSGNTQMTVGYDFTYQGNDYHATSSIALRLVTPEITLKPLAFTFAADRQEQSQSLEYTGRGENEGRLWRTYG